MYTTRFGRARPSRKRYRSVTAYKAAAAYEAVAAEPVVKEWGDTYYELGDHTASLDWYDDGAVKMFNLTQIAAGDMARLGRKVQLKHFSLRLRFSPCMLQYTGASTWTTVLRYFRSQRDQGQENSFDKESPGDLKSFGCWWVLLRANSPAAHDAFSSLYTEKVYSADLCDPPMAFRNLDKIEDYSILSSGFRRFDVSDIGYSPSDFGYTEHHSARYYPAKQVDVSEEINLDGFEVEYTASAGTADTAGSLFLICGVNQALSKSLGDNFAQVQNFSRLRYLQ